MFGKILRGATSVVKGGIKAVNAVSKVPVIGTVAKAVPGLGTVMAGASLATGLYNAVSGGSKSPGLPALPQGFAGMPALPGGASSSPVVGDRGWLQNDPNIAEALKGWAISKTNLRTAYRSPLKGFVVVRDVNGDPYALPKKMARAYAGWKPSKKPPISVGEWEAVKRADRAAKKVRKAMTVIARVESGIKGGKVVVRKKKACK